MSDLEHQLASLSPEQRRLVELLLRQAAPPDPLRIDPLPRAPGVTTFPLSFAQQRLWFLDQVQPDNAAYTIALIMRVHGPLDVAVLRATFEALVRRHEPLRTTFGLVDGQPVQLVAPPHTVALPPLAVLDLPTHDREAAMQRALATEALRPFDLSTGPLLRTTLLRRAHDEHLLLVTMHHIVSDAWSVSVLMREAAVLYRATTTGQPSPLPALAVQYADFAHWQRQWLQGAVLEQQLAYWRTQLADLPKLQLHTDYPRAATATIVGADARLTLPPALTAALSTLSQQEGATLFMTLLAVFQLLLSRYTGQIDIAVGSGIANRTRAEIEPLIGFFVNTLVLRTELGGNPSFRGLLRRVRQVCLDAYAHQDLPFEELVKELQPERDLSSTPLFQVSFVLQNAPLPVLQVPSLRMEALETQHVATKFDLSLTAIETGQGVRLRLEYNAALFRAGTMAGLLEHLAQLCASSVADPDQPIATLPLLTPAEQVQLLQEWNASARAYPRDQTIAQVFEAQATRAPAATALLIDERALSYAELNLRANQLAHHLQALGVGPDMLVGVFLPRSEQLIITLLAILKAGGAYLPLDLAYPRDRLQLMLDDTRALVLITEQQLAASLPAGAHRLVCLDSAVELIAAQPTSNPHSATTAEHLAYVMYTSGSTGRPKGVAVPQRGVLRLLFGVEYARLDATRTLLQLAPVSFDAATFEIWGALLHGGRCALITSDISLNRELGAAIARHGVTTLWLTASLFNSIIDDMPAILRPVEQLLTGGEALSLPHIQRALELLPQTQLIDGYGPTESTTFTCCYAIPRLLDPGLTAIPIGRPIANTPVYVLDPALGLVPVGVAGELYITGDGLARGYLNQPALTAEKFVPNPFSTAPGQRLYRSGDLVRWLDDGTLQFLGRIDQQVKIRGHRIEPGEIESALLQHPGVAEAAVIVREDRPGDQRLVAYVVARESSAKHQEPGDDTAGAWRSALGAQELRAFLQQSLPEYMLPNHVVLLPALPLSPNGKLDRRALPAPSDVAAQSGSAAEADGVALRTPLEQTIATVWSTVLGTEPIRAFDNFFALGGHSLLATQVVARLSEVAEVDVPLRLLFETATLATFAERLHDLLPESAVTRLTSQVSVAPIAAALLQMPPHDGSPVPLSYAQRRLWVLDRLRPGDPAYNIPFAMRLRGTLNVAALETSLRAIIARHDALRTTVVVHNNQPFQHVAATVELPFTLHDLTNQPVEQRETKLRQLALTEAMRPFDLVRGPVLRVTLLRLDDEDHVLLLTIHHIAFDGWSIGVFNRELVAFYRAVIEDGDPASAQLPPLPLQYADFTRWHLQSLQDEQLDRQRDYWLRQLADAPPLLDLPTDRPRPQVQGDSGSRQRIELDLELTRALEQLSERTGTTLYMVLLAAFQVLFYRLSGQPDILIGSPIANRIRPELEVLIGFFVNTLVLRGRLDDDPSFLALLVRTRETTLDAYAHQDIPFEMLVDALNPERSLAYSPVFQVLFVLQNAPGGDLELPGLRIEPLESELATIKCDVLMNLTRTRSGLSGLLEYSTELFDTSTIQRWIASFETLLRAIVADPARSVAVLPLLTAAEREQLLSWNTRAATYPVDACLHELVAAQAARRPDAVALVCEDARLSYAELDARANQLAHALQHSGVGPETIVSVCLDRSLDLVIALLAVFKAGAAYLPLDPVYPPERRAFMLGDAQAPVLITRTDLSRDLAVAAIKLICLDDAAQIAALQAQPTSAPQSRVMPEQTAYVIYTSGSTGTPKGVAVPHANVVRLLSATDDWFQFGPRDVWTLFHSAAFDFSVWELWSALCSGGRLVIVPYLVSRSPADFVALTRREGVTVLNQTPSAFRQFIQAEATSDGEPLALRWVIFGGEALELHTLERWFARHGDERPQLVNMYGITETTVHVTYRPIRAADLRRTGSVIGQVIPDLQLYVLDRQREPAPLGVAGELYVGGAGLARGYLGRPALTAERFVPDLFSALPGGRLYKTGDLARYLPDGELEYLGRSDLQVKLRGFRIELGEIEAVLQRYPAVREAVVVVREERPGDKQLVAYVVGAPDTRHQQPEGAERHGEESGSQLAVPGAVDQLRSFMAMHLPDYMLPSAFVLIDALPLTLNGKLDQRALSRAGGALPALGSNFVAPRTPTEQTLAAIWSRVLKREQIGIHDNFFAVGGDSIRGIEVVSAAQTAGLHVAVYQLFQHQTIAQLAAVAEQGSSAGAQDNTLPAPLSLVTVADRERLPDAVEDAYPLTQLQLGMLFHSLYQPESGVYHDIFSYHLRGQLDLDVFTQVVQEMIDRHEVLRIGFDMEHYQQPLQLVYQHAPAVISQADLRSLDPDAQVVALERWMDLERQHPFDLATPPMARFQIHWRSSDTFQLSLSFHHAILDGWSIALLLTELFQRYMAWLQGMPFAAAPLQTDFRHFVALEQAAREADDPRAFWQRQLHDRATLELPLAMTPQPYKGPRQVNIAAEMTGVLKGLAAELGVPLRSVLLTAHLAVLRLLSGQSTVITGLVTNGRPETADSERVLGLFLNSVPFQLTIDRRSWRALVEATFAAEQALLPFRRYPLAQMQRDLGGAPLFETLFNFTHFHVLEQVQDISGMQVIDQQIFARTNFALDVTFSISPGTGQVVLVLDHNERLGVERVDWLVDAYLRVLQQIAAEPGSSYSVAGLLSPAEYDRLLLCSSQAHIGTRGLLATTSQARSGPAAAAPADALVHELVAGQASRAPDAVAVVFEGNRLSYRELDERANQLARHLRALGIGSEAVIGVCLDRSLDLTVALLAVLKAGAVYLPLDPAYPAARLEFMLRDARTALVLTTSRLQASLPASAASVVCLDSIRADLAQLPGSPPATSISPAQLAYLIYTSGSTGQSKGVAVPHNAVTAHLRTFADTIGLAPADRLLQFAALSFDVAIEQLLAPLVAGARIVLRGNQLWSLAELNQSLIEDGLTVVNLPPAYWQQWLHAWLDQGNPAPPASLRLLLVGGEVLTAAAVQLWQQTTLAAVPLLNGYGPTETTITATLAEVPADQDLGQVDLVSLPIGYPLAGRSAYVLDDLLEPVPPGVVGQLYLGGDSLARGYLGRPALTAEHFVPDVFSRSDGHPGARLYRTGDRARLGPDGQLVFIGRVDEQIKLRGFRIELGEIAAVLQQHPAVAAATVILREDRPGDQQLVAYVVGEPRTKNQEPTGEESGSQFSVLGSVADGSQFSVLGSASVSELRAFLKQRLPEYMLPSAFVPLDALPLLPNGKLDPRALPPLELSSQTRIAVAPRDAIELRLVQLWEELLDVRPIGVHDSFFDLGGHSLVAVRLMAQIQRHFGQHLPLAVLFQASTIADLAALLRHTHREQPWSPLVAFQPRGSRPPLFFVHPGGGTVLCYADLTRQLGADQPVYAFQSRGLEPDQTPHTTVEAMVSEYLMALRQVQPHGPYHIGGWSFGGTVAYELARQLEAAGEQVKPLLLIDSYLPPQDVPEPDELEILLGFVRDLGGLLGHSAALTAEMIAAQPAPARLRYILEQAQQQGIVPPEVGLDQLQRLAAVFQANLRAQLRYGPQPSAVPIVQFQAAESQALADSACWQSLTDRVEVISLAGSHYTLLHEPQVAQLAQQISIWLRQHTEKDHV